MNQYLSETQKEELANAMKRMPEPVGIMPKPVSLHDLAYSQRPKNSNSGQWLLFLQYHLGEIEKLPFIAVQISEALDAENADKVYDQAIEDILELVRSLKTTAPLDLPPKEDNHTTMMIECVKAGHHKGQRDIP